MITKGTQDYQRASKIAHNIELAARTSRINAQMYEIMCDELGRLLEAVKDINCFAAQVATSILGNFGKGYTLAYISSKQAWCIACAVVENNINAGSHYNKENSIINS